jgi:LCP family protein required for cell wall assembly
MSRKQRMLVVLGVALAVAAVAGVIYIPKLVSFWNRPLGPSLGFEDQPTATEPPADVADAPDQPTLAPDKPTSEPTITPTATPEPYCGGPAEMIVMAVGIDYRLDDYLYGLADVIKIVRVDFVTPRVTVLSIPRDLWVEVPDISDHYDITHTKLNQSYFFGTEGMGYYDGPGEGAGLLARTLDLNFGIQPDHYGVVNMATFEDVVNVVGGIDIYLEAPVDGTVGDSEDNMGYYPAGWNHLNGEKAVKFARIRKVDNVFNRMSRQTQVLCALKDKIISAEGVMSVPQMIEAFSGRVLTDLSPAQMSQLACLLPKLGDGGILFASFPQELFVRSTIYDPYSHNYTFMWDVDYGILRDYIDQFLAGEWPLPSDDEDGGMSCPVYPEQP